MILLVDNTVGDLRAYMIRDLVEACRRTHRPLYVHPCSEPLPAKVLDAATCVVLSGSNRNANLFDAAAAPDATETATRYSLEHGRPILGICYGMQRVARHLGEDLELLPAPVDTTEEFEGLDHRRHSLRVACSASVTNLPDDFRVVMADRALGIVLATNACATLCAFHPEATPDGRALLESWIDAAHRTCRGGDQNAPFESRRSAGRPRTTGSPVASSRTSQTSDEQ